MVHEHLIKWGRDSFNRGFSLEHIENYFLRRGFKKHEALKALHQITAFEHKIHEEARKLRKVFIGIVLFLLIVSIIILLYFAGFIKQ